MKKTNLIRTNIDNETIGTFLARNISRQQAARATQLEAINAPSITIANCRANAENPLSIVKHVEKFQDLVYSEVRQGTGRGGKVYLTFSVDGQEQDIYYFPEARYGAFIKLGEE